MAIDKIRNAYFDWIKENTLFSKNFNDTFEISSPYTDPLNENVKIYLEPLSGKYKVTDGGYTLWNLEVSGTTFRKNSEREKLLYTLLDRMQIRLDEKSRELYINTNEQNLGAAIHLLIQGILSISDMLWYNKKTIKNLFDDEVRSYFKDKKELFDPFPDIDIQGKSKMSHHFDYLMNVKDRKKKLVRLINNINKTQVESTLLSWSDTSKQRAEKYGENLGMVVLINDKEKKISDNHRRAFEEYSIETIEFSNKEAIETSLSIVS